MQQVLEVSTAGTALARQQKQQAERYENQAHQEAEPDLSRLDAYVENCWQAAKAAKEHKIEPDMLEDIRQRDGVYSPGKLAAIREQGGSEIYMMLTNVKARAAEGWIRDILLPSGERPFTVKPSPVPDDGLPPDTRVEIFQKTLQELNAAVQSGLYVDPKDVYKRSRQMYDDAMQALRDEAKVRAERMEDAIDDVLVQGCWYEAMEDMISDLVAMPAAFMKGPVMQRKKALTWGQDARTGKFVPMAADELTPLFYSPSPLDIYPAPNSRGIEDGYLIERMTLRRGSIFAMKGVPSYDSDAIDRALSAYQHSGFVTQVAGDQQRRDLEHATNWQMSPDSTIDALEFHGQVRGEWLIEWGVATDRIDDPSREYDVTCLKIGRYVVRCVLNSDPLGRKPYMKAHYDVIKGQFWGRGLVRLLRDLQAMCNAAARAISNNMGLSSGPMVEVEVDRLAEGEDVTQLYPWRIFQTKAATTSTPSRAVNFNQPKDVTGHLMKVYDYFSKLADNYSGIPSYEQGINTTSGAAGTASGLSMLMTASSRQIKRVIASIDNIIEGSTERVHTYIMLYGTDQEVKGDVNIQSRGATSLIAKEQLQVRRNQFLQSVTNPLDAQIIGPKGRAELLREVVRSLDMDPNDGIIPTEDDLNRQLKLEQQQAQAQAGAAAAGQQPGPGPGGPGPTGPSLQTLDASGAGAGGQEAALFPAG